MTRTRETLRLHQAGDRPPEHRYALSVAISHNKDAAIDTNQTTQRLGYRAVSRWRKSAGRKKEWRSSNISITTEKDCGSEKMREILALYMEITLASPSMMPLSLARSILGLRPRHRFRPHRAVSERNLGLDIELPGDLTFENCEVKVDDDADLNGVLYPDEKPSGLDAPFPENSVADNEHILPAQCFKGIVIRAPFRCVRHIRSLKHCEIYAMEDLRKPDVECEARTFDLRNLDKGQYNARNGNLKKWKKSNMQENKPPLSFKAHGIVWVITRVKGGPVNALIPPEVPKQIVGLETLHHEFPPLPTSLKDGSQKELERSVYMFEVTGDILMGGRRPAWDIDQDVKT